jgi:hypothetical protein
VLRRIAVSAAVALGAAAFVLGGSFPIIVQLQRHALDDCSSRPNSHPGVVTVHWKSLLPPHYVCAYGGREAKS